VYVTRLACTDFRNYAALDLELPAGPVVILGRNGQGKTNLAEAIQYLAAGKSHRTSADRRLIRFDQPLLRVSAEFTRRDLGPCSIATALARTGERKLFLNGAERARLGEVLGYLGCALFSANDVELIAGEPGDRRRHLNEELAKAYPAYYDELLQFRRALMHRNRLLREARTRRALPTHVLAFTTQLALTGARVLVRRRGFVADLATRVSDTYCRIAGEDERLTMAYQPGTAAPDGASMEEVARALMVAFEAAMDKEAERGTSLVGPHRDDLALKVGGRDIRRYGSRGQQKTAAVALRLAEARRAAETDEPPVVILDDIMTELDSDRRDRLMAELAPYEQVIMIGTTHTDFPAGVLQGAHKMTVCEGAVRHGEA